MVEFAAGRTPDGNAKGESRVGFSKLWRNRLESIVEQKTFAAMTRDEQIDALLFRANLDHAIAADDRSPGVLSGEGNLKGHAVGRERLVEELDHAMIADSPERLIELAEAGYAECRRDMVETAAKMGFDDWRNAVEHVKTLYVPPGEQPVFVRGLADESVRWVTDRNLMNIEPLARSGWRMSMMSPERQKINPFFLGGEMIIVSYPTAQMTFDEKRQTMRGNNRPFSRATVHHELMPGHHMQWYQNARHRTQRTAFSTPFWTEGWALYWEFILARDGFAPTPEQRMGFLVWRAHRYCRILFSLRFHLGQMTPRQCVDFLVQNVGFEPVGAEAEVRRSIGPAYPPLYQAAYMLGAMQFQQLARRWTDSGRSIAEFHDAVMRQNNLPLALLESALFGDPVQWDDPPRWTFQTP